MSGRQLPSHLASILSVSQQQEQQTALTTSTSSLTPTNVSSLPPTSKCYNCLIAILGVDDIPWKPESLSKWIQWENLANEKGDIIANVSHLLASHYSIEVDRNRSKRINSSFRVPIENDKDNRTNALNEPSFAQFKQWMEMPDTSDLFGQELATRCALWGHGLCSETVDWSWIHVVWMSEAPMTILAWMQRQVASQSSNPEFESNDVFLAWKMLFGTYKTWLSMRTVQPNIVTWSFLFKIAFLHQKLDRVLTVSETSKSTIYTTIGPLFELVFFVLRLLSLDEVKRYMEQNEILARVCGESIDFIVTKLLLDDAEFCGRLRRSYNDSLAEFRKFVNDWMSQYIVPAILLIGECMNPPVYREDSDETSDDENNETVTRMCYEVNAAKVYGSVRRLTKHEFEWTVAMDPFYSKWLSDTLLLGVPAVRSFDTMLFGNSDGWKQDYAQFVVDQKSRAILPAGMNAEGNVRISERTANDKRMHEFSFVREYEPNQSSLLLWSKQVVRRADDVDDTKETACYHCQSRGSFQTFCTICGRTFCVDCLGVEEGYHRLRSFRAKALGKRCYLTKKNIAQPHQEQTTPTTYQNMMVFFCGLCPPFWALIQDNSQRIRMHIVDPASGEVNDSLSGVSRPWRSILNTPKTTARRTIMLSDQESTI